MLAIDIGASGGKALIGRYDEGILKIREVYRFSNDPVKVGETLYWDILRLFYEVKQAILRCRETQNECGVESLAIDTLGVDFALLDSNGDILHNPVHYRDARTKGMVEKSSQVISDRELYEITSCFPMACNTIFQLLALNEKKPWIWKHAKTLLLIPDLLNYFLTHQKKTEWSIASTTQLFDHRKGGWSKTVLNLYKLPPEIFPEIMPSGKVIGKLSAEIANEIGVNQIPVVATASHDTQAAFVAVPAKSGNAVYMSCGTWSIIGVERESPMINEKSRQFSFTNEMGVEGKAQLLKNTMGLWLIQECKRQWEMEGKYFTYESLKSLAREAEPFVSLINPEDRLFAASGNMPEKIQRFCRKTKQAIPETVGNIIRCVIQSLALSYKKVLKELEEIIGISFSICHIVGGGVQNELLCQCIANATGIKVEAGPVEASAIGNLYVQAIALGKIHRLEEARQSSRNSFETVNYNPKETGAWNRVFEENRYIFQDCH